ncbi:MAG: tRNA (N(6)-L-threonylcarbamoyladenosine(37)-C(2))-methylthiotransferase MtaB [Candidatus Marinimicrobia bacterium]|nr:tRNA (N(6)-L-threonylcarbamoyladenosine(37)-C(2))-methylthiotransferase MtaB [Candidatus Neomarinimicrobiota bacterium]
MSTQARTIAFHTLGCKLNFSETATISRDFIDRGYMIVNAKSVSDIYVINTCSVTDNADKECRKIVRQVKRRNPIAVVAMVGCYAQLKPEELAESTGADIVLGTAEKFQLLDTLESYEKTHEPIIIRTKTENLNAFTSSYSASERTRVFLKIQDGCDYPCTYCTIPMARGKSRNDSIEKTVKLAKEIGKTEAMEIVLTGVNIGDFGVSTSETFFDLIQELDKIDGIDRIRISSIEPNLLTDDILDYIKDSRTFVHHFHIPLQSGSNKILSDMKRRYRRELFADRVHSIKERFPDACIGADVIVGFPTESVVDFEDAYRFITNLDIEYLHVFSYSERSGTLAADYSQSVTVEEKAERSKRLRILSEKKRSIFHDRFRNQTLPVLFEAIRGDQLMGHTKNYIQVYADGIPEMINKILPVKLYKNMGRSMKGNI